MDTKPSSIPNEVSQKNKAESAHIDEHKVNNRFVVSPIEIGIFVGICALFINSIYTLFTDKTAISVALNPSSMSKESIVVKSSARSLEAKLSPPESIRKPASLPFVEDGLPEIQVQCKNEESLVVLETFSEKLRFLGPICQTQLEKAEITSYNHTTAFTATTFLDPLTNKFSTDYIPLKEGPNDISIEFHEGDALKLKQNFQIIKNSRIENESSESTE